MDYSQKTIRSRISYDIPGLIPDFIVGGASSMGITWAIVELKGTNDKLFTSSQNNRRVRFSKIANEDIC